MKKGFTLVELLAVILILGIILTITIYSVNSILNDSEESLSDVQENTIIESAKLYYLKEGIDKENDNGYKNTLCVSVNYLIANGYLDSNSKDENNNSDIVDPESYNSITGYVKIKNTGNDAYDYQYVSSLPSGCYTPENNE